MASHVEEFFGLSHSILPVFGGENYEFWKVKMKTLLLAEGLWSIVDKGFFEPADGVELFDEQKRLLKQTK